MRRSKLRNAVERSALVWVLAIAKTLLLNKVNGKSLREQLVCLAQLVAEPCSDSAIVSVGSLEHAKSKLGTRCECGCAIVCTLFGKNASVACRIGNNGNTCKILCSRTQHRRATDVDVFNTGTEIGSGLYRFLECIKVYHHHVDHLDAVLSSLSHMLGVVALSKKTAMNRRVKRLHATIHHLWELGYLIDGGNGNARLRNNASRATRRDDLRTELFGQSTSEFHYTRLVRYRHKNTLYLRICHLVPPFRIVWLLIFVTFSIAAPAKRKPSKVKMPAQRAVLLVSLKCAPYAFQGKRLPALRQEAGSREDTAHVRPNEYALQEPRWIHLHEPQQAAER